MANGKSRSWDRGSFLDRNALITATEDYMQESGLSLFDRTFEGSDPIVEQVQEPLHGMDTQVLQDMQDHNIDISPILDDPRGTAQALKDLEEGNDSQLPRTGLFKGDWAKYLIQRGKQGIAQSEINMLGFRGWDKSIPIEEMLSLVGEKREALPFQAENWNTGWAFSDILGTGMEVGAGMLRTLRSGLEWGLGAAPAGAFGGPFAGITVPGAAAAGMTVGVFKGASQESIGSLFLQIVEKDFEMYPDLDDSDRYLTRAEYEYKQVSDDRYTSRQGYEQRIEHMRMPMEIARPVAGLFGAVMGALELTQFRTMAKAVGGIPVLRDLTMKAARSVIQDGSLRRFLGDVLSRSVATGLLETGQEVVQEVVAYSGARLSSELNERLTKAHDVSPEAKESFFGGLATLTRDTVFEVGPAMLLLSSLGVTAGSVSRYSGVRRDAADQKAQWQRVKDEPLTDFLFEQERGEDVSINDIFVEEGDLIDRDEVKAGAILEMAKSPDLKLPPVVLSVRTDGTLIAEDPMAAAMTKVLRDAGVSSLRAVKVDRTKGIADSKQAAEYFNDDPIKAALAAQFSNDTVAEIESKMLLLRLAASSSGLSVNEWLEINFQEEGMFPEATKTTETTPTIDRKLINPPGALVDVTKTMDAPTTRRRESAYVSIDPTIPGAPTVQSGFRPTETATPARPTAELPEVLEEPAVEAAAAQMRERIGGTMSQATFLAKVQADAEAAGDQFLAQAAANVQMDKVDSPEGVPKTAAEHTSELLADIIEESGRIEAESIRQRRANTHALWKQGARERKEAAMAAELEPTDAAAPDITDVEDPAIEIEGPAVGEMDYHVGAVPREDLTPAFDTRLPAEAPAVIYVDMDDNYSILSGIASFNAAATSTSQAVEGTVLRASDGVTIEAAKAHAAQAAVLADLPESQPVARDSGEEVIPIKSDGETVGAVEFDANSKALLRAYDSMDLKSWLSGLGTVFRKMLPARETAVAARWAGAKHTIGTDGSVRWTWDDASNYKFASGFTQYLQEGKVSFPELQPIWDTLSKWTKASYAVNRTRLTKPIRDIYESFLVDEKSPSLGAYQSNIQMVGQVADMTFRSPTSSTLLRLKAAEGRSLSPIEEGGRAVSPLVFVEALDTDGTVLLSREYKDVDSAVRDISGVPTSDNPATMGDASYRPHAAKQGPVSGFYGAVPTGDVLPADAGPEGSIHVGGQPVDSERFVGDVISQLDESEPLRRREGFVNSILSSWRRYEYAVEVLASGVKGPLFQVLSRDIDKGRFAEKRTRLDLNDIQRNKLLQRGWTESQLRKLPGRMKEKVEVSGWKHKKAKATWTIAELLSFNRHLRAGQNRVTLLDRGFRDGPDGELIRVDEADLATLIRAYSTIPSDLRELGNTVVDELMDVIHEKMDPVHRKSRRRGLGYVPNYWDLERAPQDRSPEMIKEEMENADALDQWRFKDDPKLGVYEGMTHHRTRNSAPIVLRPLDFQLMRNIDRASMYVGFELPLKSARHLFEHPQARAAMERRLGKDAVRGLEKGLEGVARRWVDESLLDKKLQALQRKITVSTLGGNIPVWIKQTLSLPLYQVYVPAKYMAAALSRAAMPSQFKEMKKELSSFDPVFMTRSKGGFDITLQDSLESSAAREAWGKRRVTDVVMKGISYFDQRTVVVGSHAAFLQAINEFRTGQLSEELKRATQLSPSQAMELTADQAAETAYEYANWVTVRSQPNFLPEHVSSFQRDKITRFFSMFSGYTNVAYNMLLRTRYRAMQEKTPQARAAMAKAFLWIYIGNATGNAMINYLKQLWLGTAPEPEELPSWVAGQFISNAASHIYFVKDAIFALQNEWAGYSPSPLATAGKDTYEAIDAWYTDLLEYGEVRESTVKKTLVVAGVATGWPLYAMARYGEATIDRGADLYDLFDPMIN